MLISCLTLLVTNFTIAAEGDPDPLASLFLGDQANGSAGQITNHVNELEQMDDPLANLFLEEDPVAPIVPVAPSCSASYLGICASLTDCTNAGGFWYDNSCHVSEKVIVPVARVYQCNDGIDNDGDGKVDYGNDQGCLGINDDTEAPFDIPTHPASCTFDQIYLCIDYASCNGVGGFWYDSKCNTTKKLTKSGPTETFALGMAAFGMIGYAFYKKKKYN